VVWWAERRGWVDTGAGSARNLSRSLPHTRRRACHRRLVGRGATRRRQPCARAETHGGRPWLRGRGTAPWRPRWVWACGPTGQGARRQQGQQQPRGLFARGVAPRLAPWFRRRPSGESDGRGEDGRRAGHVPPTGRCQSSQPAQVPTTLFGCVSHPGLSVPDPESAIDLFF
jgi:hypothetical protein